MFDFLNGGILDISVAITIFSFICYYFGKLISDVRYTKEQLGVTYINGVFFVSYFILLPLFFVYTLYTKEFTINLTIGLLIVLQVIIQYILNTKRSTALFSLLNLRTFLEQETMNYTKRILSKISKRSVSNSDEEGLRRSQSFWEKVYDGTIGAKSAFIVSAINVLITSYVVIYASALLFKAISFLLTFLALSNIAILLHNAPRPFATVLCRSGKISGYLNKIESNFVTLINNGKITHISVNDIIKIELPIPDKKEIKRQIRKKLSKATS